MLTRIKTCSLHVDRCQVVGQFGREGLGRKAEGDGNQACWSRHWRLQASKEASEEAEYHFFSIACGRLSRFTRWYCDRSLCSIGRTGARASTRRDQAVGSDRSCQHVAAG